MAHRETMLERAQRHVVESQARVDHQTAFIVDLAQQGRDTAKAQALLASFKESLRVMCEVLYRQQQREAKVRSHRLRRR